MKKLCITLLLTLVTTATFAVPAKRGVWKTVRLADGSEVKVELKGDEYCKFWTSADGSNYVEDQQTGRYVPADMSLLKAKAEQMRKSAARSGALLAPKGDKKAPDYTGKKKGLIILIDFKDQKFQKNNTPDYYNRLVNEVNFKDEERRFKGSVKDYFLSQSYGQMEFDFDIVGPVSMKYSYKYYGQNDPYTGSDKFVHKMIDTAVRELDETVDYSKYDWDGDGDVEQIFIIYAGFGEASYPEANRIWPHKWELSASGLQSTLDGVLINTYACSCELGSSGKIDGIGTICHEFSHCLGLPDFYDTQDIYSGCYGTGTWDIMCNGVYNDDSFSPANYTAYERMSIGWLKPTELRKNTSISDMKPLSEAPEAYIIYNDAYPNEFYMLENRQQTGFDGALAGAGLLITHIDYDQRLWDSNIPNSLAGQQMSGYKNPHERCSVVKANNAIADESGHPYPYGTNNSLTNTTSPAAMLFNSNIDGSLLLNVDITDITRNADGTVSFNFVNNNTATNDYDLPEESLRVIYESFDKCNGNGGNDGKFSGSTVGKGTFRGFTDLEGWTSDVAFGASRCAMFGTTSKAGEVVTPEFEIVEGEAHLMFKAAPYSDNTDAVKYLYVEVEQGDGTLSETKLEMQNDTWSVYDLVLTGNGAQKIKFRADGRFFLDKVCVAQDKSSGIEGVTTEAVSADNRIYNLQGGFMGTSLDALPKGIYIVNGKKVLK